MNLFESAAAHLEGAHKDEASDSSAALGLLAELGLEADAARPAHVARLLRVAARMIRVFRLDAPDAPGLFFYGGTADPAAYGLNPEIFPRANVSGRASVASDAFFGCIGEAVEHLSKLEWGDELFERCGPEPPPGMDHDSFEALLARVSKADSGEWLRARRLGGDEESRVPADLCLTRKSGAAMPSSSGCAAGETLDHASLAAVLELVERDAAALWWVGGHPARSMSAEAFSLGAAPLIEQLRQGATGRRSWLLDITTDLDIPCVAAVSVAPDGWGLACGLAARTGLGEAARAALLELCQMELANRLVAMKLARDGPAALAPVELRHKRRMKGIEADRCALLFPSGAPRECGPDASPGDVAGQLAWVAERLGRHGVECFAVDLTREPIGVPAVRVIAPLLQPMPVTVRTARLERALAESCDRNRYTLGVDLI